MPDAVTASSGWSGRADAGLLICLLALFVCRAVIASTVVPPWQGPDEPVHFAVAELLTVPVANLESERVDLESQVLASMATYRWWEPYDVPTPDPIPTRFDQIGRFGVIAFAQPLYYGVGAAFLRSTRPRDVESAYWYLRVLSVILSLVALTLGWCGTRLLFGPSVATGALSIAVLHPQFLLSAISVNPDVVANVLGAFMWWQVARVVKKRRPAMSLALLVVAAAAAPLVKDSVIALGAVAMAIVTAATFVPRTERVGRRAVLLALTAVGVCGVLLLAAWLVAPGPMQELATSWRNSLNIRRPFGLAMIPQAIAYAREAIDYVWLAAGWMRIHPAEPWALGRQVADAHRTRERSRPADSTVCGPGRVDDRVVVRSRPDRGCDWVRVPDTLGSSRSLPVPCDRTRNSSSVAGSHECHACTSPTVRGPGARVHPGRDGRHRIHDGPDSRLLAMVRWKLAAGVVLACVGIEVYVLADRSNGEPRNKDIRRYVLSEIVSDTLVAQQFHVRADGLSSVTIYPGVSVTTRPALRRSCCATCGPGLYIAKRRPSPFLPRPGSYTAVPATTVARARLSHRVHGYRCAAGRGIGLLATRGEGYRRAVLSFDGGRPRWGDLVFETGVEGATSNFGSIAAQLGRSGIPAPRAVLALLLMLKSGILFLLIRSFTVERTFTSKSERATTRVP